MSAGVGAINVSSTCQTWGWRLVIGYARQADSHGPQSQSQEKIDLLKMLGAEVYPVPGNEKPCGKG